MSEEVDDALKALGVFVGAWDMTSSLAPDPATAPRARTTFEWLTSKRFLIQRWEVDIAEAPDGIAIIGFDPAKATYLQHYFDSRGVARVYEMTFANQVWTLYRIASEPDFSQLHRRLQRGRRHDRWPLGYVQRRVELGPRLRPQLHASHIARRAPRPVGAERKSTTPRPVGWPGGIAPPG